MEIINNYTRRPSDKQLDLMDAWGIAYDEKTTRYEASQYIKAEIERRKRYSDEYNKRWIGYYYD